MFKMRWTLFLVLCLMLFLEVQNMNQFFVTQPSPNVFKFIVSFNIFVKKNHVLILLGAHVLDFDF